MDLPENQSQPINPFQKSATAGPSPIDRQLDDALRRIGVKAATELSYMPKKISRNAPCPCGSGKKFKRCHEGEKIIAP